MSDLVWLGTEEELDILVEELAGLLSWLLPSVL